MPPRLVFGNLPGQNRQIIVPSINQNTGLHFNNINNNNRSGRVGLNLSMINRVANSRSGCSSCGK
jgi:phage replication-related protein YjqB (UPF0714/DUF867 family)